MNYGKSNHIILLGALFLGVFAFTTIVWAAFTTELEINGAATVAKQGWDIHFADLSTVTLEGDAIQSVAPTIDSAATTIGDYSVKFISPGDSATYTFNIVNAGTFGAKISTLTHQTITCTDADDSTTSDDAKNVCDNITYDLTYTTSKAAVGANDTLKAGDSVNVTLKVAYDANVTKDKLPSKQVTVSNLKTTIVYTQDNNVTTTTGK